MHGLFLKCSRRPRAEYARRCPQCNYIPKASGITAFRTDPDHEVSTSSALNSQRSGPQEESASESEDSVLLDEGGSGTAHLDLGQNTGFYVSPVQEYVGIQRPGQEQRAQGSIANAPIDLLELDGASREVLDSGSYSSIVDVNITVGGLLNVTDEDNNELFTGVGMEALIENEQLIENLRKEFSITTATHVQLAAIPRIQQGDDVVVQSHTGTGKTLAFLLPLLESIDAEFPHVQAVVIAPTRELAMQIYGECTRLCTGTGILSMALIGGANPARQIEKLRRRTPHILVGTPGRLAELEDQRALHLRKVRMLVIDEVDHSLQDNFRESIERLLNRVPKNRQLVLVSATGDVDMVADLATKQMRDSLLLRVGDKQLVPKNISNWYVVVPHRLRIETLRKLMNANPIPERAICFVNEPRRVDLVVERLHKMRIPAAALRGNAHKLERAEVIKAFRTGRARLLVTTEIAARGLDVREVTHVFNLDLPTDADHYIHRAGRCGRVGADGVVVSLAVPETAFVINRLEKQLRLKITRMEPRDGRYAEPSEHFSSFDPASDRNKSDDRGSRPDRERIPKSKQVREAAPARHGTGLETTKSKEARLGAAVQSKDSGEVRERKPHKKKRHSKGRKAQPKVRVRSNDISIIAKAHGWVGNRGSGRNNSDAGSGS